MTLHLGAFVWEDPELDLIAVIGVVVALLAWRRRSPIFPLLASGPSVYGLGCVANLIVMGLNSWHMPVAAAGRVHEAWAPIAAHTALPWLGDVIHTSAGLTSPGDLLIWAGELAIVLAAVSWRAIPH